MLRRNEAANGVQLEQIALAVCIKAILTFLEGFPNGLQVCNDGLEPGRTNLCRTLSLSKEDLPQCTKQKLRWRLEPHALLYMRLLIWRSLQKHLDCCTRWCVAGREIELGTNTVERSLIHSNWVSLNKLANPLGLELLELYKVPESKSADKPSVLLQAQKDAQREWIKLTFSHLQVDHLQIGD